MIKKTNLEPGRFAGGSTEFNSMSCPRKGKKNVVNPLQEE
jgi:hypothetical protein